MMPHRFTARLRQGAAALLLFAAAACRPAADYVTAEGPMLGTLYRVTARTDMPVSDLRRMLDAVDAEMKGSMSIFDAGSLLSRLNRNETDSVDRHVACNLALAREISLLSGGRYDVTVKPLVEAWGFAGRERSEHPNIDSLLAFVGFDKVRIENGRLVKSDSRVQLDFNSVAKGYTVDCVAALLEERGVTDYLVDIGGEVRCRGCNPHGKPWRIGIERPEEGIAYGSSVEVRIALTDGALATSGNYRRFAVDAEGRKAVHTIDPRTGEGMMSRLLSATVVADDCARADAMATMYMALGADEALRFAEAHPDERVLFILAAGEAASEEMEVRVSPALRRLVVD